MKMMKLPNLRNQAWKLSQICSSSLIAAPTIFKLKQLRRIEDAINFLELLLVCAFIDKRARLLQYSFFSSFKTVLNLFKRSLQNRMSVKGPRSDFFRQRATFSPFFCLHRVPPSILFEP